MSWQHASFIFLSVSHIWVWFERSDKCRYVWQGWKHWVANLMSHPNDRVGNRVGFEPVSFCSQGEQVNRCATGSQFSENEIAWKQTINLSIIFAWDPWTTQSFKWQTDNKPSSFEQASLKLLDHKWPGPYLAQSGVKFSMDLANQCEIIVFSTFLLIQVVG